jgi:hypothetical protein
MIVVVECPIGPPLRGMDAAVPRAEYQMSDKAYKGVIN